MNPQSVVDHVRRYPRWYGALLTWVALMVVLPAVGVEIVPTFAAPAAQERTTSTVGPPTPQNVADTGPTAQPTPTTAPEAAAPATTAPEVEERIPTPVPETVPPEEVPPGPFDGIFDLLPGLPAVDVPEELQPLLRVVSPIAQYGCSATGLASLVLAVVAPNVQDVPLERLLPYLSPVTTACANFPIPETHTVCEADEPFVIDIGGLAKSPPVIGLGIDAIAAMEEEIAVTYGLTVPRFSEDLRTVLNCEVVSG